MKLGYKVRKQGNSLMVSIPKHIQQLLKVNEGDYIDYIDFVILKNGTVKVINAADHIGIENKKLEKLSERFNVTEEQVKRAILNNQDRIGFVDGNNDNQIASRE